MRDNIDNRLCVTTSNVDETTSFAYKLGRLLQAGDTVCLTGDLGAGKTAFTGGIAKAHGIDEYITSPTFTIVHEYNGDVPIYHFDVFRIADPEEMFEVGYHEYISGDGITIIEWAELIESILPKQYLKIDIRKLLDEGPDVRTICLKPYGARYEAICNSMIEDGL